jgi:hypothetical protein
MPQLTRSAKMCQYFINKMADGDFYRGVISLGEFVTGTRSVLGPAVHEAAAWYETVDCMGISLAPSAEWFVRQIDSFDSPPGRYAQTRLPLKHQNERERATGAFLNVALAWPRNWAGGKQTLMKIFQSQLVTPDLESKYRNTLSFFDAEVSKG